MMRARTYMLYLALLIVGLCVSCSTHKNTSGSRFYHRTTAHFNTVYNGQVAFKDGVEAQLKGHVDNYTEMLPMYIVADKKTAAIGKGNFETAIEKSQKAIKRHSIKRKPKKPSGRMSDKQKAYYNRKEFNTYLRHAWMMFADAQFQKGEFIEAASSYNYIIRLYSDQPEIASVARAKLARCYVLMDWPYDAEDVFNKIRRDSISPRGERELTASRAAYLVATGKYEEAIQPNKLQKARLYYLLGQLYQQAGKSQDAYNALRKCVRLNPPYELSFNARILQTEVMAKGQGKSMIRKLRRMTKDPNNENYLDRIYYAIGNIYLADKDTTYTIYAWKKGIEESRQNGFAKAVVLKHLGELYWQRENYIDAADCYSQLAGMVDKEREDYDEVQRRSKILTEIEPHLSAVKLQDSLQALAKLPEKDYLAAIDRVIDELKKKEKEQEKLEAQMGASATNRVNPAATNNAAGAAGAVRRGGQSATFYFYNPQTVAQGKQDFQRRWGNRPNEDNWRLSQKRTQGGEGGDTGDFGEGLAGDSLSGDFGEGMSELSEEEQRLKDSLENDPHHREYYLKQIPFTEEQVEASNQLILDGLYNGGVMLMEKIGNYPLSRKTFARLMRDFPEFEKMDDVYYHLFLLSMREGNDEQMQNYLALLQNDFPESKLTRTISNPRFLELATYGRHLEDTLYAQTYEAYKAGEYWQVEQNVQQSNEDFEDGAHRAKFLFLHAMTQLYTGQRDSFLSAMKLVVEKYSQDEISQLASAYVKGIQEGRLLMSDKWDTSNIWALRSMADAGSDSTATAADSLIADPQMPYVFVLAYPTGEVDDDQLLFEMARYNFTSFMARNFDIEIVKAGVISQLRVTGFQSYDEVHAYAQQLFGNAHMHERLEGIRAILISEHNLKLLGTRYSYDDYAEFYDAELSPLEVPEELILDEPTDNFPTDIDDIPLGQEDEGEGEDEGEDDDDVGDDDDDWLY